MFPYEATEAECCYAANSDQIDRDHLLHACVVEVEN